MHLLPVASPDPPWQGLPTALCEALGEDLCAKRPGLNVPDRERHSLGWAVLTSALSAALPGAWYGGLSQLSAERRIGKGGGPCPLRPDSPKSFLHPRILSTAGPRVYKKT